MRVERQHRRLPNESLPVSDRRRRHTADAAAHGIRELDPEGTLGIIGAEAHRPYSDFVAYLIAKETLTATSRAVLVTGGEEQLLAVYLHRGRQFPEGADLLVIEPESWETLTVKPEWLRRKEADAGSYVWDRLIELVIEGTGVPGSLGAQGLDERETVLRTMGT